ncbi:hypothetical protein [Litorisediminicola beolgyonensis]|uniref:Chromosome partition protein Smc n=1 Tax=Litorisediminicola beolgyonensis TaxID=1173614 RepID=A0ABW3ZLA3_9RHOB
MARFLPGVYRPSLLSLILIGLYLIFVGALTLGFAAYITRTSIQTEIAADSAVFRSIDAVFHHTRSETRLLNERRAAQAQADEAQTKLLAAELVAEQKDRQVRRLATQRDEALGQLTHRTDDLRARFSRLEDGLPSILAGARAKGLDAEAEALSKLPVAPASSDSALSGDQDALSEARSAVKEIEAKMAVSEVEAAYAANERVIAKHRLETAANDVQRVDEALATLRSDDRLASPHLTRIRWMEGDNTGASALFSRMVSWPTILLTLFVTVFSGALGSVVSFSRAYGASETGSQQDSSTRLFVGIGEGTAAAIAIFLLSGAGMLVLSQGTGVANRVELSPYTVAFIAFVSGFMASDAFGRIEETGRQFFKRDRQEKGAAETEAGAATDRNGAGNAPAATPQ